MYVWLFCIGMSALQSSLVALVTAEKVLAYFNESLRRFLLAVLLHKRLLAARLGNGSWYDLRRWPMAENNSCVIALAVQRCLILVTQNVS